MLPIEGIKILKELAASESGRKAIKETGKVAKAAAVVLTGAVAVRILKSKKVTVKAKFGKAEGSAEFED